MSTYKNVEIAREYNVSNTAVTNWVEAAREKKNNLQLELVNGKYKIIANLHNQAELARLSEEGKKFKSSLNKKVVEVNAKFYQTFNDEEITEIYQDLSSNSEVKFKFSYLNGGAKSWDEYYRSGVSQHIPINNQFIDTSFGDITIDYPSYQKINVFDLGPGNGLPVKELLIYLKKHFNLNSYHAVDISQDINEITKKNIEGLFSDLKIFTHKADFDKTEFTELFYKDKGIGELNLILYLGHTFSNHSDYIQLLKNLRYGMEKGDRLCFTYTNTNPHNKGVFKYVTNKNADFRHTLVLSLLGIDIDKCVTHMEYDSINNARIKYLILDKDYEVEIRVYNQEKVFNLKKGQKISIWQHYLIENQKLLLDLEEAGFGLETLKQDGTLCHTLIIAKPV